MGLNKEAEGEKGGCDGRFVSRKRISDSLVEGENDLHGVHVGARLSAARNVRTVIKMSELYLSGRIMSLMAIPRCREGIQKKARV